MSKFKTLSFCQKVLLCQQKFLFTLPICCQFKKYLFEVWFFTVFMCVFSYVYSPRPGQTTHWRKKMLWQQKALITLPICCRFKKNALQSDFIYIFLMFHHMCKALGRGRQSTGDKILMTTERPFLFVHMLKVSKWSLRNLILYTFLMILYMYIAPG